MWSLSTVSVSHVSLSDDGLTATRTGGGVFKVITGSQVYSAGTHEFSIEICATDDDGTFLLFGVTDANVPVDTRYASPKGGSAWYFYVLRGTLFTTDNAYIPGREGKSLCSAPAKVGSKVDFKVDMDARSVWVSVDGQDAVNMDVELPAAVCPCALLQTEGDSVSLRYKTTVVEEIPDEWEPRIKNILLRIPAADRTAVISAMQKVDGHVYKAMDLLVKDGYEMGRTKKGEVTPDSLCEEIGRANSPFAIEQLGLGDDDMRRLLNSRNTKEETPLLYATNNATMWGDATEWGKRRVLEYLVGKGPDLDLPSGPWKGQPSLLPLGLAASRGEMKEVKLLVEAQASLNAANSYGDTPVALARQKGHDEVVVYLQMMHQERISAGASETSASKPDASGKKLCKNGCGRPAFGTFATCCSRCRGPDGPHARDCAAKAGREDRSAPSAKASLPERSHGTAVAKASLPATSSSSAAGPAVKDDGAETGDDLKVPKVWEERIENISRRYPDVDRRAIIVAMKANHGHAGQVMKYFKENASWKTTAGDVEEKAGSAEAEKLREQRLMEQLAVHSQGAKHGSESLGSALAVHSQGEGGSNQEPQEEGLASVASGGRAEDAGTGSLEDMSSKSDWKEATAGSIKMIFEEFDDDGNGVLEFTEFNGVFERLGLEESKIDTMFKAIDADHDGVISIQELINWIFADFKSDDVALFNQYAAVHTQGWGLRVVRNSEELDALRALFHVSDPDNLGKGRDVTFYEKEYGNLRVEHAWKICKPDAERVYEAKRDDIRRQLRRVKLRTGDDVQPISTKLDAAAAQFGFDASPVNEKLLLHGTKAENVIAIISNGLDERFSGGMFGQGVYLAEDPSKIDQYCTPDPGELEEELYTPFALTHPGEVFYGFVVKAILGDPTNTKNGRTDCDTGESVWATADRRQLSCIPGVEPPVHHHSLVAQLGEKVIRHREFVIFNGDHTTLEYLIAYKRV